MAALREAGEIVEIEGLKSSVGMQLNGNRAVVLELVEQNGHATSGEQKQPDRYKVRVEAEPEPHATKAIKSENLQLCCRLPLPTGPRRGFAGMHDIERMPAKLCELLVHSTDDGTYTPSEIMFGGYASMAFMQMGQDNFLEFTANDIEQMGAVLGLAMICREALETAAEAVLFALLEGNPMYIDVLLLTLTRTPCIIEYGEENDDFYDVDPTQSLTPDQDSAPYVRTMSEGPILLLQEMSKYCFAPALWAATRRSKYYHLFLQRLLRLVARETKGTRDGLKLGKLVRTKILPSMFPAIFADASNAKLRRQPVSSAVSDYMLANAAKMLTSPDAVSPVAVKALLNGGNAD